MPAAEGAKESQHSNRLRATLKYLTPEHPYAGDKASIAIKDGGDIPVKQLKLVQAWIEIHRDELFADWELAISGEQPFRIALLQ